MTCIASSAFEMPIALSRQFANNRAGQHSSARSRGVVVSQQRVASAGVRESASSSISAGAELFSLCQTAVADGTLTRRQLELLRAWLDRSPQAEVPARTLVRELVEHVLRAGRVAPADLQALGRALEPSFPQELRRRPAALRLVGSSRMAFRDSAAERTKNQILASACFMVADCQGERKTPMSQRQARAGDPVSLVIERRDASASDAVAVRTAHGKCLGYVPAERARELAPVLAEGARYRAYLISASSGAHVPVLIVQAFFYRGDATLGYRYSGTRRILPRRRSGFTWVLLRIAVALLVAAAVALVLRT